MPMQLRIHLTSKSPVFLGNSTGAGVLSGLENGFGDREMCLTSCVSIARKMNTDPNAGLGKGGRDVTHLRVV